MKYLLILVSLLFVIDCQSQILKERNNLKDFKLKGFVKEIKYITKSNTFDDEFGVKYKENSWDTYSFHKNGNIKLYKNSKGFLKKYFYDNKYKLLKTKSSFNDSPTDSTFYSYDSFNKLIHIKTNNTSTELKYDSENRMIKKVTIEKQRDTSITFFEYDKSKNVIEEIYHSPYGKTTFYYAKYDDKNNIIETINSHSPKPNFSKYSEKIILTYDSNGMNTKVEDLLILDYEKKLYRRTSLIIYEYKIFDPYNNWTERKTTFDDGSEILTSREIKYFD